MALADRLEGAVAGVIAMAVLGQIIPPLTFIPEEGLTLPLGATLGFLFGAKKVRRVLHV